MGPASRSPSVSECVRRCCGDGPPITASATIKPEAYGSGAARRRKRQLLHAFAWRSGRLLDLACGRGGDLHKWRALQIAYVKGLDVSERSLDEARSRAGTSGRTLMDFERADLRAPWSDGSNGSGGAEYDAVSCMFALHYFFESEATARTLFATVARALKVGGVFFGIVARGRSVLERLREGRLRDECVALRCAWHGTPACFGSGYTCALQGTVTQNSEVVEYLVFANVLTTLARLHGLAPVPITAPAFEREGPLHLLRPPYAGAEGDASRLYAGFALRRVA